MATEATERTFPSLAVGSAATGVGLGDGMTFSLMQEISEHVLGHPVWTYELPLTGPVVDRLLREQFPLLPTRDDAHADWKAAAKKVTDAYGDTLTVKRGNTKRTKDPLTTLAEMVDPGKIIAVRL